MSGWSRLRSLFGQATGRSGIDQAHLDEWQFHLEQRAADLEREGMTAGEALRRARSEFGSLDARHEESRDAVGLRLADDLRADLRYAIRLLRRSPTFTAVAVLSLALGIGANAAMFSLMEAVLWKSLSVPAAPSKPSTCSGVMSRRRRRAGSRARPSPTPFLWRCNGRPSRREPTCPRSSQLAGSRPSSARRGARELRRDRSILGQTIHINQVPVTIVGVNPPTFTGFTAGRQPDVFLPVTAQPALLPASADDDVAMIDDPSFWWVLSMARVPEGVDEAQLQRAMNAAMGDQVRPLLEAAPGSSRPHVWLTPGGRGVDDLRDEFSRPLMVLTAFVALVLLIACANLANLLLARAATRQREVSLRLALGAGSFRIARQMLTEGLLLASLGGAVGLLLGFWLRNGIPYQLPVQPHAVRSGVRRFGDAADARGRGRLGLVACAVGLQIGPDAGATSRIEPAGTLTRHSTGKRRRPADQPGIALPGAPPTRTARLDQGQAGRTANGREAKFYTLTAAGRRQLERELTSWDRLSTAIGLAVREAEFRPSARSSASALHRRSISRSAASYCLISTNPRAPTRRR